MLKLDKKPAALLGTPASLKGIMEEGPRPHPLPPPSPPPPLPTAVSSPLSHSHLFQFVMLYFSLKRARVWPPYRPGKLCLHCNETFLGQSDGCTRIQAGMLP